MVTVNGITAGGGKFPRRCRPVWPLALCILASSMTCCFSGHADDRSSGSEDTLSGIANMAKCGAQFARVAAALGVDPNSQVAFILRREDASSPRRLLRTTDGNGYTFNMTEGKLVHFKRDIGNHGGTINVTRRAVPEDEAKNIALEFLYAVGMTVTKDSLEAERGLSHDATAQARNNWRVRFTQSFQGVPVMTPIMVTVAADSGEILDYIDPEIAPPRSANVRISQQRAQELATAFLETRPFKPAAILPGKQSPRLAVSYPDRSWKRAPRSGREPHTESRVCWDITFARPDEPHILIVVDAETGEIVQEIY